MRIARLFSETVPVEELGAAEKRAMYALFAGNYENVNRPCFEADLFEKDCAILLRDSQDHALRGFSTQKVMHFQVDGQPLRAVSPATPSSPARIGANRNSATPGAALSPTSAPSNPRSLSTGSSFQRDIEPISFFHCFFTSSFHAMIKLRPNANRKS